MFSPQQVDGAKPPPYPCSREWVHGSPPKFRALPSATGLEWRRRKLGQPETSAFLFGTAVPLTAVMVLIAVLQRQLSDLCATGIDCDLALVLAKERGGLEGLEGLPPGWYRSWGLVGEESTVTLGDP